MRTSSSSNSLGSNSAKLAKVLPTRSEDYELGEEIGQGVSAKARVFCRRAVPAGYVQTKQRVDLTTRGNRPRPAGVEGPVQAAGRDCRYQDPGPGAPRPRQAGAGTCCSWPLRRPNDGPPLGHSRAATLPALPLGLQRALSRLLTPRALQEEIRKEAHTMSLLNHPNLVSCYCSFVSGPVRTLLPLHVALLTSPDAPAAQNLWVLMPYFAGGSVLNIMKWGHPQVSGLVLPCASPCASSNRRPRLAGAGGKRDRHHHGACHQGAGLLPPERQHPPRHQGRQHPD
jgi:serine/threonine protein kinase